jgi:hypothetical protein
MSTIHFGSFIKLVNPYFPLQRAFLFYFYVESSSSILMHQLREHSCHSEYNVHSPKIIINWFMIMLLLVLKLIVSSHPLNFEGAREFIFCCTNSGKRDTTLPCFIMVITILLMFINFILWTLSSLISFHYVTWLLNFIIYTSFVNLLYNC